MASSTIESVLQENRVFPPSPAFVKQANISGMEAYRKLVAEAERDFDGFWGRLARETLHWSKPFTKVIDESKAPFFRWFYDGELNASYNCLDRQLKANGDKVAIIFEVDDVDRALEDLRKRGAPVSAEPTDQTDWGIRVAYIRDPDGNLIELNAPLEMTDAA